MMMKTELPNPTHSRVREIITVCPQCNSSDLERDYSREELYCNHCGLVLSQAVQYNGDVKVDNIIPFSTPFEARDGIHTRWISKDKKGMINPSRITNYKHNISNEKLMRIGRGRNKRLY